MITQEQAQRMRDEHPAVSVHPRAPGQRGKTTTIRVEPNEASAFRAYDATVHWLRDQGYSVGAMQARSPTAIFVDGELGELFAPKWRRLNQRGRSALRGRIEPGSTFRDRAEVVITWVEPLAVHPAEVTL